MCVWGGVAYVGNLITGTLVIIVHNISTEVCQIPTCGISIRSIWEAKTVEKVTITKEGLHSHKTSRSSTLALTLPPPKHVYKVTMDYVYFHATIVIKQAAFNHAYV